MKMTQTDGEIIHVPGQEEYCENDSTTKCNLQIQYDPYQTTNGIFHRIEEKTSQFIQKHKRPQKAKAVLKKNGAGGINLPDFRLYTKLQSSRQYDTGTKTEIQNNRTRQNAQK